jgi:predicted O-methyltransferase YrrM
MLESAYVGAMHALARPLRASGLLPRLERAPRASWRFWFASQFAIYDAARLAALDVPWWTIAAIERVERWIAARNGRVRVFEYGSGASTAWLARRCEHVTSVEHDPPFARYITPILAFDNVTLRLVEPLRPVSQPLAGSSRRGYEDCDFSAYVDCIAGGPRYDLVIIDGRARVACLERAIQFLAEGGLVVFDNSERKRYQAALRRAELRVERCRGRTPALPYPSETTLIELQHG